MIKLFIFDDHFVIRAGLKKIVEEPGDMKVAAAEKSGLGAIKKLKKADEDPLMTDLSVPEISRVDLISGIKSFKQK